MIFTCKNCNGNVIYSPTIGAMWCPHCGGTETQEQTPDIGTVICKNCNAELQPEPYTSAMMCPACGSSVVFDERVSGDDRPHKLIPFRIDYNGAVDIVKKHIAKRIFTPDAFLGEENLNKMRGHYVPFWMYDFDAKMKYTAKGKRIRNWASGDGYYYTETSIYEVKRAMEFTFNGVPADASIKMDDSRMDLLEPYDYSQFHDFEEKYMSGFVGEKPSVDDASMRPRVEKKSEESAYQLVRSTVTSYSSIYDVQTEFEIDPIDTNLDMLPVWEYKVPFRGKDWVFHINGQTGKIIGETPIVAGRVIAFSGFFLFSFVLIAYAIALLLEVL